MHIVNIEHLIDAIFPVESVILDAKALRGISIDSRIVQDMDVFFVMPTIKSYEHIVAAYQKGVRCFVVAHDQINHLRSFLNDNKVTYLVVQNIRKACADACGLFYKNKPKELVYVTGTNGKSSTVSMLRQIWQLNGIEAATIGTLGVERSFGFDKTLNLPSLTSLDSVSFYKTLDYLAQSGVKAVACEASSHGLHQYRLDGIEINAAGFLNFTQDHLDYHQSMDEYFNAKSLLFKRILKEQKTAVINSDLAHFEDLQKIIEDKKQILLTFGKREQDQIRVLDYVLTDEGFLLTLSLFDEIYEKIPFLFFGFFQIENLLCAIALAYSSGLLIKDIVHSIPFLKSIKGRMEFIGKTKTDGKVFVDFAHSPDALENILKSIKRHQPQRIHLVFGCGGDRDPLKRPMMGKIAHQLADVVYITNDNPRSEDECSIRHQILKEAPKAIEIPDRKKAIETAIANLKNGDILIIAGKGHEEGQIIKGVSYPFSDQDEAKKCL
ncbi:MAG: UDP-N-acetylmuramoyl-L-alanyl-D-glutamate--2,6-diaminopimelate ligase [Holosporales bacterium]